MGRVRLVSEHIFEPNDVRMLKLTENFDLSYGGDGKTFPFVVQTHLKKQDESNNCPWNNCITSWKMHEIAKWFYELC